jgi:hypothetical protein
MIDGGLSPCRPLPLAALDGEEPRGATALLSSKGALRSFLILKGVMILVIAKGMAHHSLNHVYNVGSIAATL